MRTSLRPMLPATYLQGRYSQRADRVDRPVEPAGRGCPRQPLQGRRAHCYLPPDKPFRCTDTARQIAVKGKYDLWVTAAERDAMTRIVATCPTWLCPGPTLHQLWRNHPATNRIARPRSNLRPPLPPPAGGISNRGNTAARAAVLPRLCAGNLATHAILTATETVTPANDPRLAGHSTVDPVSLSQ